MAVCFLEPNNPSRASIRILGCLLLVFLHILSVAKPAHCDPQARLLGYRQENVGTITDGVFVVQSDETFSLLLFGSDFTNNTVISFTDSNETCSVAEHVNLYGGGNVIVSNNNTNNPPILTTSLSVTGTFYFCIADVHQGTEPWLQLTVELPPSSSSSSSDELIPLPVEIIVIIILMVMSGLFSGLNLGLMALDPTTLKIIIESGTKRQRKYAKSIFRVRKRGNYLLCTLLLGNVLVNSTLTVLLDNVLGSGAYAIVASTVAIVIFGEIVPQAICSRYGLIIGANTIYLTYIFMVLTFPLSFPISLLLNLILGKEIGSVYNRDQLLELLKVTQEHHDLERDEVNIISGVLEFKKKKAEDVMTKFDDVYFLNIDSVLDFKTMRDIYDSGFSRIPVYEGDKQNIVGLLYVRDLAFVDAGEETPLSQVLNFYKHELKFVFHDSSLDVIFQEFSEGKCHMAVVQRINSETEGDPFYEVVGVVTLEDIVEEILGREIVDETDRFMDNRTWRPRERKVVDVGEFVDPSEAPVLSSQQRLAVYQFLSTGVEPFKEEFVSSTVLKRLLMKKNIVHTISLEDSRKKDTCLYKSGSPAGYFTLVLEGCMKVQIGKDGFEFETRSFSHFGVQALICDSQHGYLADFTLRPAGECQVLIITQREYLAACRATKFERTNHTPEHDVFTQEWERAESHDLETCRNAGSSLSPISKLLPKKFNPKRKYLRSTSSPEEELLLSPTGTDDDDEDVHVVAGRNCKTETKRGDTPTSGSARRALNEWTTTEL